MIVNGTDLTLPLFALASFLLMFGAQLLCCRAQTRLLRHLPWGWVAAVLVTAVAALFGDSGGWIDLREFFAKLLCAYAALCAAGIGLAHLVRKLQKR